SFHGGFLGVCAAVALFARRNQIDILRLGDLIAPVAPIGIFFGRIANFINGELWGRPTDGPFGIIFCNETIQANHPQRICPAGPDPRHPSQLYEAGLEGLALFLILAFAAYRLKWLRRRGALAGGQCLGQLHVGGVVRAGRIRDRVLARIGEHVELVRGGAADRAGVGE
ncbi:MAG: prolipoprotein diacylglyceryl transferase, partial [Allorhizobium sp.]